MDGHYVAAHAGGVSHMKIDEVRSVLRDCARSNFGDLFTQNRDSFFIESNGFLVAAIRSRNKYSSLCQELEYWLCAGHEFVSIDGKRSEKYIENVHHYPFRIPWDKSFWVKLSKLYYDPMSWDSRVYRAKSFGYSSTSKAQLEDWFRSILKATARASRKLKCVTPNQALAQITKANGDVWLGKQYIESYEQHKDD